MSGVLTNPYKRPGFEVPRRQISTSISEEDWLKVYMSLPFRGTQDAILATLFHEFIKRFDQSDIPNHYEPANTRKIQTLLSGNDV